MSKKIVLNILLVFVISIFLCSCNNKTEISTGDSTKESNTIAYEEKITELQEESSELNEYIIKKDTKIDQLNNEKNKLENDILNSETRINHLTVEIAYIRKYLNTYLEKLDEDELLEIALNEWMYSIHIEYINADGENIIIPIETQMNLDTSSFSIELTERMPCNPILEDYQDIFMRGQLENYRTHISLVDSETHTWEEGGRDGTIVTTKIINVYDLDEETTVVFNITDLLKKRLNLQSNYIEINIQ